MSKRAVAIVGGGEATAQFAPFNDPEWEIWGLAWHTAALKRCDLLFDIHDPDFKAQAPYRLHYNSHKNQKYINKVNASGVPIMCDPASLATFKKGMAYPIEEVRAHFPKRDFLECTISYMLAQAIWEGRTKIGLWGCHFTGKEEYQCQLPSATWLIGYAEAKGIEIVIGPGGPLLVSACDEGRYGINHNMRPRTAGPTDWMKVTMSIELNERPVRFCVPNQTAVWRVETIETKEPKTVEWIRNMPAGSCLWDIGANIGIYSAYAAAYGHDVVAVEANGGFAAALAQTVALSDFDNVRVVHAELSEVATIDELIKPHHQLRAPTHIKIDTDGADLTVLKGATEALTAVQSVIVETNEKKPETKAEIDQLMTGAGFVKTGRHVSPNGGPEWPIGMDHWHRA